MAALVAAAPRASAAPLPALYAGRAIGDVAAVDLNFPPDPALIDVRLANSEATADPAATPRAFSASRNLAAAVPGLSLAVETNSQTAPPDNPGPVTGTLASARAQGITAGAITTSNEAHWAGDNDCVTDGPIAKTTTTTAGLDVSPGGDNLLTTDVSSVTTTTGLVSTGGNGLNRAVESVAVGTLGTAYLLGGLAVIDVAGDATLTASANGKGGRCGFRVRRPSRLGDVRG